MSANYEYDQNFWNKNKLRNKSQSNYPQNTSQNYRYNYRNSSNQSRKDMPNKFSTQELTQIISDSKKERYSPNYSSHQTTQQDDHNKIIDKQLNTNIHSPNINQQGQNYNEYHNYNEMGEQKSNGYKLGEDKKKQLLLDESTKDNDVFHRPIDDFERQIMSEMDIKNVYVAFVKGNQQKCKSTGKNMLNQLVSSTGQFTHCEIAFKGTGKYFGDAGYMCCTVYQGERVIFELKNYKRSNKWEILSINLSKEQARRAFIFCLRIQGRKFSLLRIAPNFLPFGSVISFFTSFFTEEKMKTFFCSELVGYALLFSGNNTFQQSNFSPETTTPSILYQILIQYNLTKIGSIFGDDINIKL